MSPIDPALVPGRDASVADTSTLTAAASPIRLSSVRAATESGRRKVRRRFPGAPARTHPAVTALSKRDDDSGVDGRILIGPRWQTPWALHATRQAATASSSPPAWSISGPLLRMRRSMSAEPPGVAVSRHRSTSPGLKALNLAAVP
jgi:hypothetical protein